MLVRADRNVSPLSLEVKQNETIWHRKIYPLANRRTAAMPTFLPARPRLTPALGEACW